MRKVTSISFAFGASESMTSKDAKPKSCVRFERHVEDRLIGRRNILLGLWAGAQLGLREERCAIYALQIMAAGMMSRGLDDVVDRIAHDFAKQGISITRGQILVQLSKVHRFVWLTDEQ